MSAKTLATLVGSIAIWLWGTLALLTTLTGGQIPPFQLMAISFAIAYLLMASRWWQQGHLGLQHLRQPWPVWLLGISGYFGYHFCYFTAMNHAPAVEVSLLAYLWPLLILFFAALLPGESLKFQHIVGAVLALTGCWYLIGNGETGFSEEYLVGYLLALACALIWSGFSVLSRLVKAVPTDAVGWFCAATALLALFCHLNLEETVWPTSSIQWLGIFGLGLGPVGIAFFAWDYGVKRGDLQLLGVLSYGAPLISVLMLIVADQAEFSTSLALASCAIVGGSLIAAWKKP